MSFVVPLFTQDISPRSDGSKGYIIFIRFYWVRVMSPYINVRISKYEQDVNLSNNRPLIIKSLFYS